jgi:hypothetical protein
MKKYIILLLAVFVFSFCEKNETDEPFQNLVYQSLTAERDTISPGENTNITALASGSNLKYFWTASSGDILGSGNKVVYAPSPCHSGSNTITCKITNGNQTESKSVIIVVLED